LFQPWNHLPTNKTLPLLPFRPGSGGFIVHRKIAIFLREIRPLQIVAVHGNPLIGIPLRVITRGNSSSNEKSTILMIEYLKQLPFLLTIIKRNSAKIVAFSSSFPI
jgi:hypothetical protein